MVIDQQMLMPAPKAAIEVGALHRSMDHAGVFTATGGTVKFNPANTSSILWRTRSRPLSLLSSADGQIEHRKITAAMLERSQHSILFVSS